MPTEQERCEARGIDVESVDCPVCGAFVGWGCSQTHAGRYGGSHVDPVHPARARAARAKADGAAPGWRLDSKRGYVRDRSAH